MEKDATGRKHDWGNLKDSLTDKTPISILTPGKKNFSKGMEEEIRKDREGEMETQKGEGGNTIQEFSVILGEESACASKQRPGQMNKSEEEREWLAGAGSQGSWDQADSPSLLDVQHRPEAARGLPKHRRVIETKDASAGTCTDQWLKTRKAPTSPHLSATRCALSKTYSSGKPPNSLRLNF